MYSSRMERACRGQIQKDLESKIVMLTGPRQCGKTTLSKMLFSHFDYFNYDYPEHRVDLKQRSWDRSKDLIIFDELHKMKNWKSWLKGISDVEGIPPRYIVTGSARLDTARKAGDSLAGRYFLHQLHPFDIKEVKDHVPPEDALERILNLSGFPEPFLQKETQFYRRWKKTHTDIILRQDLLDMESIRDIPAVETLIELIRRSVGSPVSYASLARNLERDSKTVKTWLTYLENLYILFPVRPYHRNIARAILKEPKYYLFDTADVFSGKGGRLENCVACSLLKELHRIRDTIGYETELQYLRTKDKKEIDFAVTINGAVTHLIEVKSTDNNISTHFKHFSKFFPDAKKIQLVRSLDREKTFPDGTEIRNLAEWLGNIDLSQ